MTYDPARELTPVALVALFPILIVAHPSLPVRSPAELIAHARANPGRLSFASSGIGNPQHLAGELLNRLAGIELLHVPYRGAAPALTDVAAGRVDLNFSALGGALPLIREGRLRPIAVTSRARMPQLPEVPALAETPGLEVYDLVNWFGLFAPAAMLAAAVERLPACRGGAAEARSGRLHRRTGRARAADGARRAAALRGRGDGQVRPHHRRGADLARGLSPWRGPGTSMSAAAPPASARRAAGG
jgi:hypothetical protein